MRSPQRRVLSLTDPPTLLAPADEVIEATSVVGTFAKCRPGPGMSDVGDRPEVMVGEPKRRV
jgi:hypothetical protein